MKYKASIIIPVHDSGPELIKAVESCVNQTEKNIEIIIVDNGSITKYAKEVANKFCDPRIKYIYSAYANRSAARNIGINIADGQYLQFLDADDELDLNKIKMGIDFLLQNKNYHSYITSTRFFNQDGVVVKEFLKFDNNIAVHNTLVISAPLLKNENIIHFREDLVRCEDWLFWIENLLGKNNYFNQNYFGSFINVTGSNSMSQADEMIWYGFVVRQIIQSDFKKYTLNLNYLKYTIIDIIEILIYGTNERKTIINKKMSFYCFFARFILKTPIFSHILKEEIKKVRNMNVYI